LPKLAVVRILTRYLLREFLVPWIYCFDAFALLWIVMNLFDNLPDFIQHNARVGQVARYYLVVFPEAFVLIMPISLLLGLLFCLSTLARHNELTALRASGVSLIQIATPLLAVGLAASLAVLAVNDLFVPRARQRGDHILQELRGKRARDLIEDFFYANPLAFRDWYAPRFDVRRLQMHNPEVHQRDSDGRPVMDLYAERAEWADGLWRFHTVSIYDHRRVPPEIVRVAQTNFPAFREKPAQMSLEGRRPEALMSWELRRHIRARLRAGRAANLAGYQVELHYRYAFPFMCLVVVWLAIPLGMRVGRSGPLLSVGAALMLVVAFYFLTNIVLAMGKGGYLPPSMAAWSANFIFAAAGAILMWRAR
jgi:lipopolysaccharide export system permease protein